MRHFKSTFLLLAAGLWAAAAIVGAPAAALSPPDWTPTDVNPAMARQSAALAHDSARDVTVLFGGRDPAPLGDTWEYDGASWSLVTPAHAPSPRFWHAMAYDGNRRRVVLFGGGDPDVAFYSDETWEYDGEDWQLVATAHAPSGRVGMSMAFDSARDRVVLFGGQGSAGESDETWEYDGADWTAIATATSPPAAGLTAMAFDAARARTILLLYDGTPDAATWEYDGFDWTAASPAVRPPGRWAHAMAYSSARRKVVLFGGYEPIAGLSLNDTWEYAGEDWAQVATAQAPAPRQQHSMTYDSRRQRVVLFGGGDDTWEYGDLEAAPPNLAGNHDFSVDVSQWSCGASAPAHQPGDGAAAAGSLDVIADPATGNAYCWTCIDVSAQADRASYVFGGWVKAVDFEPLANDARSVVQLNFYSGDACTGFLDVAGGWEWWVRLPMDSWRRSSWGGTAPAGTRSVLLFAGMVQAPVSPPGTVRIDDAFVKAVERPSGLVCLWAFDGDARDQGVGAATTLFGSPTYAPGRFGQAIALDGIDDFVRAQFDISPAPQAWITMGAWVRADSGPRMAVLSQDDGPFDRTLSLDERGPGGEGWAAFQGEGVMGGTEAAQNGQFQFVAVSYDDVASTVALSVDGGLERGLTNLTGGEPFLEIGRNPSFGDSFHGLIDEVFVFDRVLSPEEIDYLRVFGVSLLSDNFESGDFSSWPLVAP